MPDVFSDLRKAVTELFQARSERPFTLLEVPPIVIVTVSSVPAQRARGDTGKKGKGKGKAACLAISQPVNAAALHGQ